MDLQPLITGTLVPRRLSGTVYSTHEHILNIREGGAYRLVSLIANDRDLTALSALVTGAELVRVARVHAPGRAIALVLADAPSWDGRLPAGHATPEPRQLCALCSALRRALALHGRPGGFLHLSALPGSSAPFAARAARELGAAEKRLRTGGPQAKLDLGALVGLGIGFTPSGDDFVMGVLAAEALSAAGSEGRRAGGDEVAAGVVERSSVAQRLATTTPGGATLLGLALQGSFPRYIVDFVEALPAVCAAGGERSGAAVPGRDRTADMIEAAVREAVAHGETSGTDAVAGFCYGLVRLCSRRST